MNNDSQRTVLDLGAPGVSSKTAKRVLEEIDRYCQETYDDGHRNHLGASLIGRDCKRYLWYVFRWVKHVKLSGRHQRLFNRGHREEERFVEWLEGVGFKVWFENRDGLMFHPESDSYWLQSHPADEGDGLSNPILESDADYLTHVGRAKFQGIQFPQYRISDVMGHFGGSLDGIAMFPPSWGIDEAVLLEFKTNGTGRGFLDLTEKGMAVKKPEHFAQTSTYGLKYGFRYVLYLNICKNDDNIHIELVELNHSLGEHMIQKADSVIRSQEPPAKISLSAEYQTCSWCDLKGVCHGGDPIEINCRSCAHARPVEGAQWICGLNEQHGPIPKEVIKVGCNMHKAIC